MSCAAFLAGTALPARVRTGRDARFLCSEAKPPNDPSELRTESQRRRNAPLKPMRRRRRRARDEGGLDWEAMESVPLVGDLGGAAKESGEDYWIDVPDAVDVSVKKPRKEIGEGLKEKLKEEVVSPYKNNWISWAFVIVGVLAVLWSVLGGADSIPVIRVPDL